jgi:energy-coupling factor transport system permease protein
VPRGLTLYAHGTTFLHRAHPFTKGVVSLVAIALAFISPSLPWVLVIAAMLIGLLAYARVLLRFVPVALGILLPITLLILLVQGLANPANRTILIPLGPFSLYREGLTFAIFIASRLFDLVAATFLFSFTTRPADFAEALMQRGLSPRFGYVVQSALQIIPESLEQADRIRDAQQARGLETTGPLLRRARAFIPLLLPLVLSSLVATQERAMALEVRGFGLAVHRHARILLRDDAGERLLRWALVLLVLIGIAARFLGWR